MKYTAEFDSLNTADIAAAAIKKYISDFSEVNVYDKLHQNPGNNDNGFILFSGFNPTASYSFNQGTAFAVEVNNGHNASEIDMRTCPTIEVTCRTEDAKNVSRLIVGYGGRNIRTKH